MTGCKYSFEIDELLSFPLKIKDLTPQSYFAIELLNMEGDLDVPFASTVINVFSGDVLR